SEYAAHIHINDLDPAIHTFWSVVLNNTDALCQRIWDTKITIREWKKQRAIQLEHPLGSIDLAFSTFFLNRTNRAGIIMGGVIGGKGQLGIWKLDARFNKKDLIQRIERIASYKDRISLYDLDAADFLTSVVPS